MTQPKARPGSNLTDFYREEFLKHRRCLEQQREYYSTAPSCPSKPPSHASFPARTSFNQTGRRPVRQRAPSKVQRGHRPFELDRSEERSLRPRTLSKFRQDFLTIARGAIDAASPQHLIDRAILDPAIAPLLAKPPAGDRGRQGCAVHGGHFRADRRAIAFATASSSARICPSILPVRLEWIPSSHPLPDERSVAAGRRALEVARRHRSRRDARRAALGWRVGADGGPSGRPDARRQAHRGQRLAEGRVPTSPRSTRFANICLRSKEAGWRRPLPARRCVSRSPTSWAMTSASSVRGRRCRTRPRFATHGTMSSGSGSRACSPARRRTICAPVSKERSTRH